MGDAGKSDEAIEGLRFKKAKGWPRGIYIAPRYLVAVSELPVTPHTLLVRTLPVTPHTLLVRTLGAGETLRHALAQVDALRADSPVRAIVKNLLVRFSLEVPKDPAKQTDEDKEFVMDTQEIYQRWEKETELRGELRGVMRKVIDLYELRFGPMPPALRTTIEATQDAGRLDGWFELAATQSANEVGAAIRRATTS